MYIKYIYRFCFWRTLMNILGKMLFSLILQKKFLCHRKANITQLTLTFKTTIRALVPNIVLIPLPFSTSQRLNNH